MDGGFGGRGFVDTEGCGRIYFVDGIWCCAETGSVVDLKFFWIEKEGNSFVEASRLYRPPRAAVGLRYVV